MLPSALDVSFVNMPAMRVAYLAFQTDQAAGAFDAAIRETFDRVKEWVQAHGGDIRTTPAIGIAHVAEGRLQAYECCIPIGDEAAVGEDDEMQVKTLPGGNYAVVKIAKQSSVIGETIGRFFQEYVPTAGLHIDGSRPTLETYWDTTMDFCVPIT